MKTFVMLISLLMVCVILMPSGARGDGLTSLEKMEIEDVVIQQFCQALKNGDVKAIIQYLSEDMANVYRILLEQNREYPTFLRRYFHGAKFNMIGAASADGGVEVDIVIQFPNGSTSRHTLKMTEEDVQGIAPLRGQKKWRIGEKPLVRKRAIPKKLSELQ